MQVDDFEAMDYQPDNERIAWLRQLTKGRGLAGFSFGRPPRLLTDMPLELFGVDAWSDFTDRIDFEVMRLPERSPVGLAAMLAINVAMRAESLVGRRALAAEALNTSSRTVERLEGVAFRIIDDKIQRDKGRPLELLLAQSEQTIRDLRRYVTAESDFERIKRALSIEESALRRSRDAYDEHDRLRAETRRRRASRSVRVRRFSGKRGTDV